jgi:hypothetical protein
VAFTALIMGAGPTQNGLTGAVGSCLCDISPEFALCRCPFARITWWMKPYPFAPAAGLPLYVFMALRKRLNGC